MIDLSLILLGAFTCYIAYRLLGGSRREKLVNKIPGPFAYPIVGNMFTLIRPQHDIIPHSRKQHKKYGPILRFWAGPIPIIGLAGAEYVETMLSNNQEIEKSFAYGFVAPWLGEGLLTSKGSRWTKHRKMITPTFHFKILDSFIPVFESNSAVLIQKLAGKADTNEVFDIYNNITLCALDIICETAMGINLKAQNSTSNEYISAIYEVSALISKRISRVYLHPNPIYNLTPSGKAYKRCIEVLHNFTKTVISERKAARKNLSSEETESEFGVKKRKAFLDLLLDAGADLSDTDLREEVDTFMFEGHDTTTAGISWALYLLGRHPEIQEQVAEEILSLWPEGEHLTHQMLNDMKILERVIKETLRIYPSVPFISRQLKNDLQFGEYLVPAGTTMSVAKVALHMDEKYFPNPTKFDPDRFLPENVQNRHPYAYVPFSAGPRNCIGQKFAILEEKAVLASIVRAYKLEAVEKEENILVMSELIQRPKNGIKLRISRRV